jgi:sodium-coupled neutral amino acid transporter 11
MFSSCRNVFLSILHQGLPYAVKQAGFFTGIVLLLVLCAITDWTIRLIVVNAKMSGRTSYLDVMHQCFGTSGRAAVSLFQFAFAFGGKFLSQYALTNGVPNTSFQACVLSE